MAPFPSRLLLLPIAVAALIAFVGVIGTAQADERGRDGRGSDTDLPDVLDYVPLRMEDGYFSVHTILIQRGTETFQVQAEHGMRVQNQDTLPLARVPFFGAIFEERLSHDHFDESKKLADVAGDQNGETLFLRLSGDQQLPQQVVVVNRNNAFFLNDTPAAEQQGIPANGREFGTAYWDEEKSALLILVRPSVLTDSTFF